MDDTPVLLGRTLGGKEIYYVRTKRLAVIQFGDGGRLPPELKGRFTDIDNAQKKVNSYLAKCRTMKQELDDAELAAKLAEEEAAPEPVAEPEPAKAAKPVKDDGPSNDELEFVPVSKDELKAAATVQKRRAASRKPAAKK